MSLAERFLESLVSRQYRLTGEIRVESDGSVLHLQLLRRDDPMVLGCRVLRGGAADSRSLQEVLRVCFLRLQVERLRRSPSGDSFEEVIDFWSDWLENLFVVSRPAPGVVSFETLLCRRRRHRAMDERLVWHYFSQLLLLLRQQSPIRSSPLLPSRIQLSVNRRRLCLLPGAPLVAIQENLWLLGALALSLATLPAPSDLQRLLTGGETGRRVADTLLRDGGLGAGLRTLLVALLLHPPVGGPSLEALQRNRLRLRHLRGIRTHPHTETDRNTDELFR